jgi:hypothetical protein
VSEWSVHVEARGAEPLGADDQTIEAFAEQLADYSAAVGGAPGFETYSAQLSLEAPTPDAAVALAVDAFCRAAAGAGLPDWPVVEVDVIDADELDRQLAIPNFPELLGISEIADILDVSRQRAHALAGQGKDFPEPVARLASGPVWTRPSINRFVEEWQRKPGRPPAGDEAVAAANDPLYNEAVKRARRAVEHLERDLVRQRQALNRALREARRREGRAKRRV